MHDNINSDEIVRTAAAAAEQDTAAAKPRRKHRRVSRKTRISVTAKVLPFFLLLAVITVSAWMLPLRPTMSAIENRNLERFPEFSVEALLSGEYFSGIDSWFADTFTFRESWMDVRDWVEGFYGRSSIVITGSAQHSDAIPVVPTASPAIIPEVTAEPAPVQTGAPIDEPQTSAEPTPEPTPEVTPEPTPEPTPELHSVARELEDIDIEKEYVQDSECVIMDGNVYPYVYFNQYFTDMYCDNLLRAAELLEGKARVFSVIPLRNTSVMLSKSVREYMGCALDEEVLDYIAGRLGDKVTSVDSIYCLQQRNSEYIYFHSDHHWTALGAYYVYAEWCKAAGFEPVPLEDYYEEVFGPYTGTFYWHNSKRSPVLEDEVHTYDPPGDIKLYIIDSGADAPDRRGFENSVITHVVHKDYYAAFLASDHALCTFVNDSIEDESAVLLIKDSYGNPFSYYFTQHYKYVYVMDYRYYTYRGLTNFVDTYGVSDVIFCPAMFLAQSDAGNALLANRIR